MIQFFHEFYYFTVTFQQSFDTLLRGAYKHLLKKHSWK